MRISLSFVAFFPKISSIALLNFNFNSKPHNLNENYGSFSLAAWQKPAEKSVCMPADHTPQKNTGISSERLLKDPSCKEREPTIRDFVLCLTKLKRIDLADEFEKYFSPSEDHKGNPIYITADIDV